MKARIDWSKEHRCTCNIHCAIDWMARLERFDEPVLRKGMQLAGDITIKDFIDKPGDYFYLVAETPNDEVQYEYRDAQQLRLAYEAAL